MLGILAAFDVSRNGGPASLEGADFLAATNDQDASSVPEDRRDDALCFHVRELERTSTRVDDDSISREQTADIHAIQHRNPREGRADRDDGVCSSIQDRGGTLSPFREGVENVPAHRASLPPGECEDAALEPLSRAARRGLKDRSRGPSHAADAREKG